MDAGAPSAKPQIPLHFNVSTYWHMHQQLPMVLHPSQNTGSKQIWKSQKNLCKSVEKQMN